ncbi:hypothetical protein F4775DRAFT_185343 [Biscogniauxia sp. FL1348]|nr:hypothetical protein F4775DRAFT_185343 [Biscogniauxia sp. FL1348]
MTRDVQTVEDQFQHNLRDFQELFHLKQDAIHTYTAEVVKICNAALTTENIRHTPITSRVKSWESAKGSIMRRQRERLFWQRICSQVTTEEPVWVDYSRSRRLDQRDIRPFQSAKEMLQGLHDLGGVRLSLYFPGDIAKVVNVLKTRFRVLRVTEKGQSQPSQRYLKDFLDELSPIRTEKSGGYERTFGGYIATHVVVGLHEADIPKTCRDTWKDIVIEIQVGTLVMHMWSEIEHDMIYKPLEAQGSEISEDEKRILDLFNGIVMTGEAALRQLEISTSRRLNQRAQDQAAFASSHYELVLWIESYYKEKGKPLTQGEWELLDQLFAILQVNGDHQHGKVESILEQLDTQGTPSRLDLPGMILEALCAEPGRCKPPPERKPSRAKDQALADARFWGTRLIQSTNVAIYLGAGEQFVDAAGIGLAPPALAHFLDLMHPYSPYPVDAAHAARISAYCQKVLSQNLERGRLERVAARLPHTGRVDPAREPRPVLVPGLLTRLFDLRGGDATDSAAMLGFIHDHVSRGALPDDLLPSSDGHSSTARKPIAQRAFVSQAPPWEGKGAWWLEDLAVKGEATMWDVCDGDRVPVPDLPAPEEEEDGSSGVVGLACRFYPKARWGDVRRAWKVAGALRPAVKLGEGGGGRNI